MTFKEYFEQNQSKWLEELNKILKDFYLKNRLKMLVEANDRVSEFFEDLKILNFEYVQSEEGLISESYAVRQFYLDIQSLDIDTKLVHFLMMNQLIGLLMLNWNCCRITNQNSGIIVKRIVPSIKNIN